MPKKDRQFDSCRSNSFWMSVSTLISSQFKGSQLRACLPRVFQEHGDISKQGPALYEIRMTGWHILGHLRQSSARAYWLFTVPVVVPFSEWGWMLQTGETSLVLSKEQPSVLPYLESSCTGLILFCYAVAACDPLLTFPLFLHGCNWDGSFHKSKIAKAK